MYLRFQVRRYVILFEGRTGSSYLTEMFWSHPNIRARGEGLSVLFEGGADAAAQARWAREALTPPWLGRYGAVGFKTKHHHLLDPAGFAALLRGLGAVVIHMRRRNLVKLAVSEILAKSLFEATGAWNIRDEKDRLPARAFSADELRVKLAERDVRERRLDGYVRGLGLETMPLDYEDLLHGKDEALRRVFGFLRVPARPVKETMRKHLPDDLRRVILNFDELRGAFRGTPYAAMFDEGVPPA